jgi:glycosyltransferase involved in cell wall biosynthesis
MCWGHALAGPAARRAGIVSVWYQHNRPEFTSVFDWWAAVTDTSMIVANSQFTARLQRRINFRRQPIEVVYPPIEPPQNQHDNLQTRKNLGFSEGDVVALLPARLQRWKGQDTAIRALASAARESPHLRLLLAGGTLFGLEPQYKGELESLARKLGVTQSVRFAGHCEDLGSLYDACDLMLHTSRDPEPYGLVVAEARAHGCAIIASDAGAIPEQITHGQTGLLVPPNDSDALAAAMVRLARDKELRRNLGEAAGATHFQTATRASSQFERLYDKVLAE